VAENPNKVAGFAGINPVGNLASNPGVTKAAPPYRMTPKDLQARLAEHNPVDCLAPLAKAGVPSSSSTATATKSFRSRYRDEAKLRNHEP
jgi:hypothetical protein